MPWNRVLYISSGNTASSAWASGNWTGTFTGNFESLFNEQHPKEDPKRWYEILGVAPNADKQVIKRAFREVAMEHHPDKGGDPEMFRLIQQAYEEVKNAKD